LHKGVLTLLFLVAIILAVVVRVIPFSGYSNFDGGFQGVFLTYPLIHMTTTGHNLQPGEIPTWGGEGNGIYSQVTNPLTFYLHSIILIVTGNTSIEHIGAYIRFALWPGVVLFGLVCIMLGRKTAQSLGTSLDLVDSLLIYLFVTVGSIVFLGVSNEANVIDELGWAFIILIFYFCLRAAEGGTNKRFVAIALLFSIIMPFLKYTTSAVLIIILLVTFIFQRILKKRLINATYFLFLPIAFIEYEIFVAPSTFEYFVSFIPKGFQILPGRVLMRVQSPSWWTVLYATNIVVFSLPTILLMYWVLRRKINHRSSWIAVSWVFAIPLLAGLFFAWGGLWGIATRGVEYATVICAAGFVVCVPFLRRKIRRKVLTSLVVVAILTSVPTYISSYSVLVYSMKETEAQSQTWLISKISNVTFVFIEFKYVSALLLLSHMRVAGLSGFGDEKAIDSIYYSENSTDSILQIRKIVPTSSVYLVFSRDLAISGIILGGYAFPPVSNSFFEKYDNSTSLVRIYDNGQVPIYFLTEHG
jgi:hypothetical protein